MNPDHTTPNQGPTLKETMLLEQAASELMFHIGSNLSTRVKSFQVMKDADFVHRKDRTTNDIHIFLELKNGQYFQLRAYVRHMLDTKKTDQKEIFLTGYLKPSISQVGGEHALRQEWYQWDPEIISQEIVAQNPKLF